MSATVPRAVRPTPMRVADAGPVQSPYPTRNSRGSATPGCLPPAGAHAPVGVAQPQRRRCRSAGRKPVHQMTASTSLLGAVVPRDARSAVSRVNIGLRVQHAAVAGVAHAGDHHDVAQAADPGMLTALLLRPHALGRGREQRTAVDVVGEEPRRPRGDPEGVGDRGDLGQDLRRGVPATDDGDPLAGELLGVAVADGVQLTAGELAGARVASARTAGPRSRSPRRPPARIPRAPRRRRAAVRAGRRRRGAPARPGAGADGQVVAVARRRSGSPRRAGVAGTRARRRSTAASSSRAARRTTTARTAAARPTSAARPHRAARPASRMTKSSPGDSPARRR